MSQDIYDSSGKKIGTFTPNDNGAGEIIVIIFLMLFLCLMPGVLVLELLGLVNFTYFINNKFWFVVGFCVALLIVLYVLYDFVDAIKKYLVISGICFAILLIFSFMDNPNLGLFAW